AASSLGVVSSSATVCPSQVMRAGARSGAVRSMVPQPDRRPRSPSTARELSCGRSVVPIAERARVTEPAPDTMAVMVDLDLRTLVLDRLRAAGVEDVVALEPTSGGLAASAHLA